MIAIRAEVPAFTHHIDDEALRVSLEEQFLRYQPDVLLFAVQNAIEAKLKQPSLSAQAKEELESDLAEVKRALVILGY